MHLHEGQVVLGWQTAQYAHDKRNHFDIVSRHKVDRLKHYGLHFAKYAGRLARGENAAQKTEVQTAIDSLLVSLSAANTVSQKLLLDTNHCEENAGWLFRTYTASAGMYCDAVEKIDHAEFDGIRSVMFECNQSLFNVAISICYLKEVEVGDALVERRKFLSDRVFFIGE